jgi:succinate-semialdehyde dehydrogenase/glutarate-semialdehyde dehydrogenase
MELESRNPTTGEVVARFPSLSEDETDRKLDVAAAAFDGWSVTPLEERARLLAAMGQLLRDRSDELGKLATLEMGKTWTSAKAEVNKCAWVCDYYAENGAEILEREVVATDASSSYVRFDPMGILLAVMPWNFPFWQVLRFAAPALMAGNVALLKHASNVPQCAQAIDDSFAAAGFPAGVFQNLAIGSGMVERVLRDPRVRGASLTGSEHAGSQVAMQCGREIKPTVLELGGSDPFVVLADADLELAIGGAVASRFQCNGQSCIAAKRFVVVEEVAEEFLEPFRQAVEALKVGDPMEPATDIGPVATRQILDETVEQVRASVAMGAEIVTGGEPQDGEGYFHPPTILRGVASGQPAYDQEVFGPVAACIVVADEAEAVRVANDTAYGLGASVWTRDTQRGEALAAKINAGSVFVNGMVKSDPRLPFGGVGLSGYGRELSHYGMKELVNIKTVWVR